MDQPTEESKEGGNKISPSREISLVLSIDKNGKIIQFNGDCEKITGYNRQDVLNKELFDFLIPKSYLEQWPEIFNSVKQTGMVNDLNLPWLTNQGNEIMISWSVFPVKSDDGLVENICFVGKPIIIYDLIKEPTIEEHKLVEPINEHIKDGVESKAGPKIKDNTDKEKPVKKFNQDYTKKNDTEKEDLLFKFGNKKIVFKKSTSEEVREDTVDTKNKVSSKKEKKAPAKPEKPVEKEKLNDAPTDRYDDISETIKKLEEEYEKIAKDLDAIKNSSTKNKDADVTDHQPKKGVRNVFTRWLYVLFDTSDGKTKKEEIKRKMQELDERKAMLDDLEFQLLNEKKNFNETRAELQNWREKLEVLEGDIEKRRNEMAEMEKMFKGFIPPLDGAAQDKSTDLGANVSPVGEIKEKPVEHHTILDKIPGCAAVIQRGILKQINDSFADLLGYGMDEVVGKSLFDFIVPEGLMGLERYYLDRLKGGGSPSYETVLLTKDNNKVAVEVSTKPTTFNGEKAEIAVIKRLENQIKE